MSANLEIKKQLVEEIKSKIKKAKSLIFVDYRGITVEEDTVLRTTFRNAGAEYKVYKNRLMLRALFELGISGCDKLEGTTAIAIGYTDEVTPAKLIVETIKNIKKLNIKFGILNGNIIEASSVNELAELPSKEVLIAKLLSILNAPATCLVNVLSAPIRGLACALDGIKNK